MTGWEAVWWCRRPWKREPTEGQCEQAAAPGDQPCTSAAGGDSGGLLADSCISVSVSTAGPLQLLGFRATGSPPVWWARPWGSVSDTGTAPALLETLTLCPCESSFSGRGQSQSPRSGSSHRHLPAHLSSDVPPPHASLSTWEPAPVPSPSTTATAPAPSRLLASLPPQTGSP